MDPVVARIIEAMERKGLDQKTLATQIGIRPQAITEWKKGVTSSYTKYLSQIADVLGITVEYLLGGDYSLIQLYDEVPPQPSMEELFEAAEEKLPQTLEILQEFAKDSSSHISPATGYSMYIDLRINTPDNPPTNKKTVILKNDGQTDKLASAFKELGINVDKLTDAEINRIARLAKAALEE